MKQPMKVRVYYDQEGQIVSILEVKTEKDIPPASIFSIPDTDFAEIELTRELSEISLLDLHTKYKIDVKEKKAIFRQMKTKELQE